MGYPDGLHSIERPGADPGAPALVLVHGSLDRAESFRRVMRRLPELTVVAYDRRGYQGSRGAGVVDLTGHVADLLEILAEVRSRGPATVTAIGHSVGGEVVIGAAQPGDDRPRVWSPVAEDPAEEVERFFSRMVSPSAWARLSDEGRASRRDDGPALVADLLSLRGRPPFTVTDLAVPVLFGVGGDGSATHHREAVAWLGSHVPGAATYAIDGAQHGAHLSHPDHFAAFARAVVQRAGS
jgi:pimeloyl-ACP methyl ester carboxylesterase